MSEMIEVAKVEEMLRKRIREIDETCPTSSKDIERAEKALLCEILYVDLPAALVQK